MTSFPSVQPSEPTTLPSLPPSPTSENVTDPDSEQQREQQNGTHIDKRRDEKGKGRLVESPASFTDDDEGDTSDTTTSSEEPGVPTRTEEAETRRVHENLRRWEVAERQRRKAARGVIPAGAPSGSIVGDVTRRASLLWSGRRRYQRPPSGVGSHRALRTQESEDGVPLEELESSPPISLTHSREPSMSHHPSSRPNPDNPFENPSHIRSDSTSSLNTPLRSAVMSESSDPSFEPRTPTTHSSSLSSSRFKSKRGHPPPKPLDLPRPRTPPPRVTEPPTQNPSASISSPTTSSIPIDSQDHMIEVPEKRWWTDWLCGCSEGPDRGGDHQAGRTNPFA